MVIHQDSITCAILFGDDTKPQIERLPDDFNAEYRMSHRLSEYGTPHNCHEATGARYSVALP